MAAQNSHLLLPESSLKTRSVNHRLSSVAFPHSNCRAEEVGVKTVKRLITSNTGPYAELNTDAFQRAMMLQYQNSPATDTKLSPAMCIFGRPIRDLILPGCYRPRPIWHETLEAREEALRNCHMKAMERWSEHTKRLTLLIVGGKVRIQNQTGPHSLKWDKAGQVVKVRQFDKYVVRVDGSGCVILRNRRFLRKYIPIFQPIRLNDDFLHHMPTITPPLPTVWDEIPSPPLLTNPHSLG